MSNLEAVPAECLDSLMIQIKGKMVDDPANAVVTQGLEAAMEDSVNLISAILKCNAPGCNREFAVTTAAGFVAMDASFDEGECFANALLADPQDS